jgi:hypothetical protein
MMVKERVQWVPKWAAGTTMHEAFSPGFRAGVLAAWERLGRPPVPVRQGSTIVGLARVFAMNWQISEQQEAEYTAAFVKLVDEADEVGHGE